MRNMKTTKRVRRCLTASRSAAALEKEQGVAAQVSPMVGRSVPSRESKPPDSARREITFARGVARQLRACVLDDKDIFCAKCGVMPGDIDDCTGRDARFRVAYLREKAVGGTDERSNLCALCTSCDKGSKLITLDKPTRIWLLSQVRRAGPDEQRAVFNYLVDKFGFQANS